SMMHMRELGSTSVRYEYRGLPVTLIRGSPPGIWSLALVWLPCPVVDDPGGVAARCPGRAPAADRDTARRCGEVSLQAWVPAAGVVINSSDRGRFSERMLWSIRQPNMPSGSAWTWARATTMDAR